MMFSFFNGMFSIPKTPKFGIEYISFVNGVRVSVVVIYDYKGNCLEYLYREFEF